MCYRRLMSHDTHPEAARPTVTPNAPRRSRAPKRLGERAQLTIPDDLMRLAEQIAASTGTTRNDVLVRLATAGAEAYERRQVLAARVDAARRAAFRLPGLTASGELSEGEMLDAVAAMRRDG